PLPPSSLFPSRRYWPLRLKSQSSLPNASRTDCTRNPRRPGSPCSDCPSPRPTRVTCSSRLGWKVIPSTVTGEDGGGQRSGGIGSTRVFCGVQPGQGNWVGGFIPG